MNKKGFAPILILLAVVVVLAAAGGIWYYEVHLKGTNSTSNSGGATPAATAVVGVGDGSSAPIYVTTYTGVGSSSNAIAFDGTNMWVANEIVSFTGTPGSVTKITPSGVITTYKGTGSTPAAIAFDGTNMWTANLNGNSVTKISPTGAMTTYPGTGAAPDSIAFDGTNMWTSNLKGKSVTRITPVGVMTTYILPDKATANFGGPADIAFDGKNMWVTDDDDNGIASKIPQGSVTEISPSGVMTTYVGTDPWPTAIAFDGTNMWTANRAQNAQLKSNSVTKISPTGVMTTYSGIPVIPMSMAFDGTNMWVVDGNGMSVTKVTPLGTMTTYTLGEGEADGGIAFDGTNMWVANYNSGSVTKINIGSLPAGTSVDISPITASSALQSPAASDESGKEAHDGLRIQDMATLKAVMNLYLEDMVQPDFSCGDGKTIYASAPITPPSGWKAGANMGNTAVDGNGWIPINFDSISSGAPISRLPIDPVNDSSQHLVYLFACNAAAHTYEIDAVMESQEYGSRGLRDVVSTDGGNDPNVYEIGNDKTLIPDIFWQQ
jgi:hypothetical protein